MTVLRVPACVMTANGSSPAVNIRTADRGPTNACAGQENCTYMSLDETTYSRNDLADGLRLAGLRPGGVVFFQVSHLTLGPTECGSCGREVCDLLYSAMRDAVGPE